MEIIDDTEKFIREHGGACECCGSLGHSTGECDDYDPDYKSSSERRAS